jgi:predicted anti-sigma-YlaC factor YlaD
VDKSKFDVWVNKILATEEEEISCSLCFDLVSDYVDMELAGAEMPDILLKVKSHINQCLACRDEYQMLRELAELDTDLPD